MFEGVTWKTLGSALLGGVLPTILWLRFWFKSEDSHDKEPIGMIALMFIGGMITVMLALPAEKLVVNWLYDITHVIIAAATIEEVLKFSIIFLIAFSPKFIDEPTDYALFLITGGLGFAALENTLFLLEPITHQDVTVSVLTGNLRFLGATVLHTVASASAGIALGLAFYQSKLSKIVHGFFGLCTAIALHAVFNYLILQSNVQNTVIMFATLWVSAIILLLMFEKLKHLRPLHKVTKHTKHI